MYIFSADFGVLCTILKQTILKYTIMKHFIQISRVLAAKKLYLFVLVMLMSITGVQKANAAKEIYAALSGSTMTLYYDDQKASCSGVLDKWSPGQGTSYVPEETRNSITKAVISPSMKDAFPKYTSRWFYNLTNLTAIDDLTNLNTANVTSMYSMFQGCSSLTSLDLSNFNTANVAYMFEMFKGCSSLTSLDLSSFNTANVESMYSMFQGCESLTSLDVSSFNTANVTSMYSMFYGCSSLTSLDVSSFNTANVTSMFYMFEGCSSLTSLDLSNFNTANVENLQGMFYGCSSLTSLDLNIFNIAKVKYMEDMLYDCSSLKTIYCDDDWSKSSATSADMFGGCTALVGSKGTKYNPGKVDKSYARPDGLVGQRGYFTTTVVLPNEIYATLNGATMTLYYDDQKAYRPGVLEKWSTDVGTFSVDKTDKESITTAVLDASMRYASPTSTCSWFGELSHLATITGLNYLNTENVTLMWGMFAGCSALTELNVSCFNIGKVTTMDDMFSGCSSLKTIYCNDVWSTSAAQSDNMFKNCTSLVGGKGTEYDAGKIDKTYARPDGLGEQPGYFTTTGGPKEIYAALSGSTMTIYYDEQKLSRPGILVEWAATGGGSYDVPDATCYSITKVVIDASMVDARPTYTHMWFDKFANLISIDGLTNLNTSEVVWMHDMFQGCESLTSLDLSSFNTANVTDMSFMFFGCSLLTSLDMSKFNTAKVEDMKYMFFGCTSLTSLDVSNFNTANVTNMNDLFYGCSSLTSLDVSNFNTAEVTNMNGMFAYCSSLTSLDVSNFNTANVTDMNSMFSGCSSLKTIYCDDDWSTSSASSNTMFKNCTSLVGGDGTKYNFGKVDKSYARPDGLDEKPGYFTAKGGLKRIYAALSGSTMTLYYDDQKASRPGVLDKWDMYSGSQSVPEETRDLITKAVIDASMVDARPIYTHYWFGGLTNLTTIDGLANLNTSEVKGMSSMFSNCPSLTSLNVSGFNTANVKNMALMFYRCSSLTSLDVTGFNTANVTNMNSMFEGCSSLTSLDVSSFNTANVTSMYSMFYGCSSLKTIYCNDYWSTSAAQSDNMFKNCTSLVGGNGTEYDAGKTDKTYARPDGLDDQPGYFTTERPKEIYAALSGSTMTLYYDDQKASRPGMLDKWSTDVGTFSVDKTDKESITTAVLDASMRYASPTSTCSWFGELSHLATITGLNYLNTENVTLMWGMFAGCSALTELNVSCFNIGKVTTMDDMFSGCSSLKTIYCDDAWNPSSSDKMFSGCTSLVGGKGTKYDAGKIDKTYARPDGLDDQPGYFTAKGAAPKEIYAALSGSTMTIYYDDQKASRTGVLEEWNVDQGSENVPAAKRNLITTAVINPSMKKIHPTSNYFWFGNLVKMTNIEGMENLNTSEVVTMLAMFSNCISLTDLDLSSFNTAKVKDMSYMFYNCSSLTSLDLSSFNTANVESMFNMFYSCYSLKTIYCDDDWSTRSVEDDEMFFGCTSLVGGNGTEYDAGKVDKSYARLDGLGDQPGYFTAKSAPITPEEQKEIDAVIDLINAIGTVTYTPECKARIDAARSAYDALTAEQKVYITDATYKILTDAEQTYADLKAKAEADQAAANAVIVKIDAIGTVTYTPESKALIDAAREAYDALTAAQQVLVTNYGELTVAEQAYAELKANAEAVANAKLQLKNIISEANQLKAVALIYAPSVVTALNDLVADAQSMIDDPSVTVDQVNTKAATLTGDLHTIAVNLLDQAKEQLKQSIIALFLPGDYPSWYGAVITPALNQVDGVTWDFNKSVNENIVFFQATGTQIYNDTKSALEALRASDKRSIISSCAFTGFENGIKVDMTWNISALNNLINTLNASVATEPYRLDAEMSSLGKWDPINATLVVLDPHAEEKLTAGEYQFVTAVRIDGEEAKQYRLPKATEEALSVSVDATPWTVDLSSIVIDVTYCYTVVNSPMFTVSNVPTDVELTQDDQLKTQKIFRDGHIYILRGDHVFDIRGTMVK